MKRRRKQEKGGRQRERAAYPKSGRFRFHGAGKDYYRFWQEYRSGQRDESPPDFVTFQKEWRQGGYSLEGRDRFIKKQNKQNKRKEDLIEALQKTFSLVKKK